MTEGLTDTERLHGVRLEGRLWFTEEQVEGIIAAREQGRADLAAEIEALPESLSAERKRRGLSLRDAAEQIPGVGFNTLTRIERRISNPTADHIVTVLRWLAADSTPREDQS